jgi:hypothetical protein
LVIRASGTVALNQLPAAITTLPRFVIELANDETPGPATFNNRATLRSFVSCLAAMLPKLEVGAYRNIRKMHVVAAISISAAIELGRHWPVGNAAPTMVVYHLDKESYQPVLEVPWRPQAPPIVSASTEGAQP